MSKKALLIGSQIHGLQGVESDIEQMKELLENLSFTIFECSGRRATRSGILTAFNRFIDHIEANDTVLVYYSGHGGLIHNSGILSSEVGDPVTKYQYIVPIDIDESTESDFRGILNIELSAYLASLTQITNNVTAIYDCCYAAWMSRESRIFRNRGLQVKAHNFSKAQASELIQSVKNLANLVISNPETFRFRHAYNNPNAIRLVATSEHYPAYEFDYGDLKGGMLTYAFTKIMKDSEGTPITWDAMIKGAREIIMARTPDQRPDIEGAIKRIVFDTRQVDAFAVLAYSNEHGRHILKEGKIYGVSNGATYYIMPVTAMQPDTQTAYARATVKQQYGSDLLIDVEYMNETTHIPVGARAFPLSVELYRGRVMVNVSLSDIANQLKEYMLISKYFALTENDNDKGVVAIIQQTEEGLLILNGLGELLAMPLSLTTKDIVEHVIVILERWARALTIRTLSNHITATLPQEYEIEWGYIVEGEPHALEKAGEELTVNDHVYVSIRNHSRSELYVHLFDIGIEGAVSLLLKKALLPGEELHTGKIENNEYRGIQLQWSINVPQDKARLQTFIVVISDKPQDLDSLAEYAPSPNSSRAENLKGLESAMNRLRGARARNVLGYQYDTNTVRYAIEYIDFYLRPQ